MQRTRTAPPAASEEVSVASLPGEGLPPLNVLIQEARAPDAARSEVDALLVGLAQPAPSEDSLREHADLLLALIEDKHLGDFTGSDGRTVRTAAVQALLALGFPYALEVPPEALGAPELSSSQEAEGEARTAFSTTKGQVGVGLITLLGLAELIPFFFLYSAFRSDAKTILSWGLGIILGTTFLPMLFILLGQKLRTQGLKMLGTVWLIIVGLLWLAPGLMALLNTSAGLIPIGMGLATIIGTVLMDNTEKA